jgi:hypothetical protein
MSVLPPPEDGYERVPKLWLTEPLAEPATAAAAAIPTIEEINV